jgi:hypothetical protein
MNIQTRPCFIPRKHCQQGKDRCSGLVQWLNDWMTEWLNSKYSVIQSFGHSIIAPSQLRDSSWFPPHGWPDDSPGMRWYANPFLLEKYVKELFCGAKLAVFGYFSGLSPTKTHSFAHSLVYASGRD